MKLSLSLKLATLATLAFSASAPLKPASATNFDEVAVDQNQFIAVAVPYNYRRFRLAIIEQIPGQQPCWRESGFNPATVELLLLNFDHTNSCRKAVDTNGYSLRINGKDDKVAYVLNLVENNGEIQLVADHRDSREPDLVVGRTNGLREAPLKINLDPNWQFTKRLYNGSPIQHIYMSNSNNPQQIADVATIPPTNLPPNPVSQPAQPDPVATQPNSAPATPPNNANSVQGLVSSILTPLTQAVYQTYNSLFTSAPNSGQSQFAPDTSSNNRPQANADCQGVTSGQAIWSDPDSGKQSDGQEITISGDGMIELDNGEQIDIKPTLSSNGIDPVNFLTGQNSAELDFDGDGEMEGLEIVQPPQPCTASSR